MRYLEPLVVLLLVPILIGVGAERIFRETRAASFAATLASLVALYVSLRVLDPDGGWNWLAALLVSPLPVAAALAAVLICCGRSEIRRPPRRNGA